MSSSDDIECFDEERYLESDEFMEGNSFIEETWSPNPKYMQRSKIMSRAIRLRVQQQSEAHTRSMPEQSEAHTQTIPETNVHRLSYVAIFGAFIILLCVLVFILKEPCNCTCTINI